MKLIIDNGGSNLDWFILGDNIIKSNTGINIFDSYDQIVSQVKESFSSLLPVEGKVDIDFYTTGLTDYSKNRMIKVFSKCFSVNSINIFSDMLAASRALFDNHNGIACILGTGSNCAYFDGKNNQEITYSTGYLLGDEGSGYSLGKQLLRYYFAKKLPVDIHISLEKSINLNRNELLSSIYSTDNPKFYIASFTKFIKQHESHPFFKEMINDIFLHFLEQHPFQYPEFNCLNFGFVGSIAFHFKSHLEKIMQEKNLKYMILEKPIRHLNNYYLNQLGN